jgi:hypothetical protein
VVAFLSSGRCGTRWLAQGLRTLYRGVEVEHEPIGPLYRPRQYFRRFPDPEAILEVPEVAEHVARIERMPRPYIETGWPMFPALPLLAQRVPDRLRIVHLTRHPVPSALSHLARRTYAGSPRSDAYTRWATLGPTDPNVFQWTYADCWDRLTPYEKCLFWWTEVHLFALEFRGRVTDIPVLQVSAEQLLSGNREVLAELLEFMALPWREQWLELIGRRVDRWHRLASDAVDPLEVHRHPTTVDVAARLGYAMAGLNVGSLEARYSGQPHPALDDRGQLVWTAGDARLGAGDPLV